jgi:hypothetical protein
MTVNGLPRSLFGLVLVALAAAPGAASAAEPAPSAPARVRVVAAPRYKAGALHKFLLGPTYRRLWITPVEVEVLDLRTFAGGLKPVSKGGGKQTKSLKFESADGREWRVRSVDKNAERVVPLELRDSFAEQLVQDQMSAANPAGPLIVDGLSEAAGILTLPHRLVVLPDDPLLGKYRGDFANMLGLMEEDPRIESPVTPGFEGFTQKHSNTVELWEHLDAHPGERVDARAFLKARLFDVFIGDFDRHDDQWDWLKRADNPAWVPYPTDRDEAFAKFDGFILSLIRPAQPKLVNFEKHYSDMVGLTWQGRFLDRRHLTTLEWPVWQEVAAELQARLTDPVIDAAVKRMPPEYYRIVGRQMATKLKARRNLLPAAARKFYVILAKDSEAIGTDKADSAQIRPAGDGRVEVILGGAESGSAPYFQRRYDPRETREVRVYLRGGDDRVGRGPDTERLFVRVIGGDGNDVLDDSKDGHTHFYDSVGENRVIPGPDTHFSDVAYVRPVERNGDPARDWGHMDLKFPWLSAGADLGVFLGAQWQHTAYGFRKDPYENRQSLRAGYSTGLRGARAEYQGEFISTNSKERWLLLARYSAVDLLRFYGFGNETCSGDPGRDCFADTRTDRFHQVPMRSYILAPAFRLGPDAANIAFGPVVRFTSTRLLPDRFITLTQPYGVGDFGEVGASARFVLDGRNRPRAPRRGGLLWASGTYYPAVWSVDTAFGEVHGEASTYLSPPLVLDPILALRVGGKRVWGRHPFQESAFLGGLESVRGLRPGRYAGDAAAYANAELRLALFRFRALVPARFGIFGLADAGRVWLEGEDSTKIHTGLGGGIWVAFLKPDNTLSLAAARSEGHLRVYFYAGFAF